MFSEKMPLGNRQDEIVLTQHHVIFAVDHRINACHRANTDVEAEVRNDGNPILRG